MTGCLYRHLCIITTYRKWQLKAAIADGPSQFPIIVYVSRNFYCFSIRCYSWLCPVPVTLRTSQWLSEFRTMWNTRRVELICIWHDSVIYQFLIESSSWLSIVALLEGLTFVCNDNNKQIHYVKHNCMLFK